MSGANLTDPSTENDFTPVTVALRSGRRVKLRTIASDDGEALQAAFDRLSMESRYMRFMTPMRALPPYMLERAVHPVAGRDLALVALADAPGEETDGRIVAGARYLADAALQGCEFGIAVADDWCGLGLASLLMQELIRSARARGLKSMEGFILTGNTPMRKLARRLGFQVAASDEGPGVVRMCLDLGSAQAGEMQGGQDAA
ncbi:MAG: GNAT family N-acetyltransferase [Burkholderiales bacterium]|nr:GNAT family N-acetyltransferase [Burkholderiales bacterium]